MPSRKAELETNCYYHVYNRGCNKQTLFHNQTDYARFYKTTQLYSLDYPMIEIFCYCLLPNHFHFLLRETSPDSMESGLSIQAFQISNFMRKVQQSYAMYFNQVYGVSIKQGLKAPIFEGRFQAKRVDTEDCLGQLQVYIEHNAVKHELVDRAEDWPWTSWSPDLPKSGLGHHSRVRTLDINPVFE